MKVIAAISVIVGATLSGCGSYSTENNKVELPQEIVGKEYSEATKEFKSYWNKGKAEITSYALEQARYGEVHKGTSAMIFVTEPFSKELQVKPDKASKDDEAVLKLNFTKKFTTGIYPYSMMTSTFTPINYPLEHSTKVTTSSQEWCGHTFTQLNNRDEMYTIQLHSYFEDEGDQKIQLQTHWLEDEVWSKIRLDPTLLPIGEVDMIPSFFFIRLRHKETKPYKALIEKNNVADSLVQYKISYAELDRELVIYYKNSFPFEIEKWEETYTSGFGDKAQKLTTKGIKMERILSDYWNENGKHDTELRKQLRLSE